MKNCINCGATIEYNRTKCPYCDTSYFDFTNIDFDNKKPVVLKLKINGFIIETLCVPNLDVIESRAEESTATGCFGEPLMRIKTGTQLEFGIKFNAVHSLNNLDEYLEIHEVD